jgi:hypothetical protein
MTRRWRSFAEGISDRQICCAEKFPVGEFESAVLLLLTRVAASRFDRAEIVEYCGGERRDKILEIFSPTAHPTHSRGANTAGIALRQSAANYMKEPERAG